MKQTVLSLLFLIPILGISQKKWTLDECIQYAEKNNLSVKNAQMVTKMQEGSIELSKMGNIPNVGIGVSNQFQIFRENNPATLEYIKTSTTNSTNMNIGASMELFGGLRKYYSIKKAISDFDVSEKEAEVVKNNISLEVIQAYMSILLNKELLLSAQKQIDVSLINIEKATNQYKAGILTEDKLQNLLMQKDQEEYALVSAKGMLKNAIVEMCNLLNLNQIDSFDVVDIEFDDLQDEIDGGKIDSAVENMPEIEKAALKIQSEQVNINVLKSSMYPSLSINASYGSSFNTSKKVPLLDSNGNYVLYGNSVVQKDYPIGKQIVNNQMGYVGLSLNIPITTFFQSKKNVEISKARVDMAKNELENNKIQQSNRLRKLEIEIETAKEKYKTAQMSVEKNEKILFHINKKFENGVVTISDYNLAKENLLISQARVSSSKYEYLMKKKIMDFYLNKGQ